MDFLLENYACRRCFEIPVLLFDESFSVTSKLRISSESQEESPSVDGSIAPL